jgi:hypothetical protein
MKPTVKVKATITLVMSEKDAVELVDVLGRLDSGVCEEVYLVLADALKR